MCEHELLFTDSIQTFVHGAGPYVSWENVYTNDPIHSLPVTLTPAQQALVLGGEAVLFGEFADATNVDPQASLEWNAVMTFSLLLSVCVSPWLRARPPRALQARALLTIIQPRSIAMSA